LQKIVKKMNEYEEHTVTYTRLIVLTQSGATTDDYIANSEVSH